MEIDFEKGTIIDNFLTLKEYDEIYRTICNSQFPFGFSDKVINYNPTEDNEQIARTTSGTNYEYYFANMVYKRDMPNSPHAPLLMNIFIPKLIELGVFTSLMRIKVNLYPYIGEVKEHGMHTDQDFFVKGAVFCINTCDGYTKYNDTKFDSVKNRMIFFDSGKMHTGTTASNTKARININFNFL
tara:strand:+ start:30 stop:581 length:552 start_codon:yes stop_codon:yes gene_type:complete